MNAADCAAILAQANLPAYEYEDWWDQPQADAKAIMLVAKHKFGIELTQDQAAHFWRWHSLDYDAGWLECFPSGVEMWLPIWFEQGCPQDIK